MRKPRARRATGSLSPNSTAQRSSASILVVSFNHCSGVLPKSIVPAASSASSKRALTVSAAAARSEPSIASGRRGSAAATCWMSVPNRARNRPIVRSIVASGRTPARVPASITRTRRFSTTASRSTARSGKASVRARRSASHKPMARERAASNDARCAQGQSP